MVEYYQKNKKKPLVAALLVSATFIIVNEIIRSFVGFRIPRYFGIPAAILIGFLLIAEMNKAAGEPKRTLMKLKYIAYIIPLIILIFVSWILWGTPSVRKGAKYLLSNQNESYVFVVTDIERERTDKFLFESIKYMLYPHGSDSADILTSFIKYRSIKRGDHSYDLIKIDGTTQIVKGSISFTWSYESTDQVYLYLEDGTKLKKIKDV